MKTDMKYVLQELAAYLRNNQQSITTTIYVPNGREDDHTYGNTDDYEVIDFDGLVTAIDNFAETLAPRL